MCFYYCVMLQQSADSYTFEDKKKDVKNSRMWYCGRCVSRIWSHWSSVFHLIIFYFTDLLTIEITRGFVTTRVILSLLFDSLRGKLNLSKMKCFCSQFVNPMNSIYSFVMQMTTKRYIFSSTRTYSTARSIQFIIYSKCVAYGQN